MSLVTDDLLGVEILEAGVRIHGVGSPLEGDLYTVDDLQETSGSRSERSSRGAPSAFLFEHVL